MRTFYPAERQGCECADHATGCATIALERQKKTLRATEQDTLRVQGLRFAYRDWMLTIDPYNLVFVDESGVNLGMTRRYGRAIRGERVHDSCPRNTGQNISLLGALSLDGLIATMSIQGSVNTDVFVTYLHSCISSSTLGRGDCSDG